MKRRIIALLCAGCLFSLTACQEDIEITEVPMPPVEEEPEPTPDDTDKIYECEHPLLLTAHSAGRADASPTAKQLRNDAFQLALYNGHPGLRAHEYRSTIIENWMRGL